MRQSENATELVRDGAYERAQKVLKDGAEDRRSALICRRKKKFLRYFSLCCDRRGIYASMRELSPEEWALVGDMLARKNIIGALGESLMCSPVLIVATAEFWFSLSYGYTLGNFLFGLACAMSFGAITGLFVYIAAIFYNDIDGLWHMKYLWHWYRLRRALGKTAYFSGP